MAKTFIEKLEFEDYKRLFDALDFKLFYGSNKYDGITTVEQNSDGVTISSIKIWRETGFSYNAKLILKDYDVVKLIRDKKIIKGLYLPKYFEFMIRKFDDEWAFKAYELFSKHNVTKKKELVISIRDKVKKEQLEQLEEEIKKPF